MSTVKTIWKQLPSAPISARMGEAMSINKKDEFILVTTPYKFAGDDEEAWSKIWYGIFKYDTKSNKWCKWIEYDHPIGLQAGITYNKTDGKLYLVGYTGQISIFDIENQKTKIITGLSNRHTSFDTIIIIDKNMHLINDNSKHFVCNIYDNEQGIKIMKANDTDIDFVRIRNKYNYESVVQTYIASKNIIIAIGCVDYTFDEQWSKTEQNMIMIYSISKHEWKSKIDLQLNQRKMDDPKILVTHDEKYVIIIGEFEMTEARYYGWEKDDDEWNMEGEKIPIYVLEICDNDKYILKQCIIELPLKREFSVAITGGINDEDTILVSGYLRIMICYNYDVVPHDIMNEILKWISDNMIHWIEYGTGGNTERRHFVISLSKILSYCD